MPITTFMSCSISRIGQPELVAQPADEAGHARPSPAGSCRRSARRAAAASARSPARARSPAGAGRRRAGCCAQRLAACRAGRRSRSSSRARSRALRAPRARRAACRRSRPSGVGLQPRVHARPARSRARVMLANRRMFWKVRAMPSVVICRAACAGRCAARRSVIVAARRRVEAGDHVEERRLAGAVRADQADDRALLGIVKSTSLTATRPPKRLVTPASVEQVGVPAHASRARPRPVAGARSPAVVGRVGRVARRRRAARPARCALGKMPSGRSSIISTSARPKMQQLRAAEVDRARRIGMPIASPSAWSQPVASLGQDAVERRRARRRRR